MIHSNNMTKGHEFKFTDTETGKIVGVPLEAYVWVAIYNDDTYLKQFDDETGLFHQFREIDRDKLDVFALQCAVDPSRRFEIHMKPGMKPIHFYRNTVFNAGTPHEKRVRTYFFGYEEVVNGRTRKTLLQVFPNHAVAILNGDSAK